MVWSKPRRRSTVHREYWNPINGTKAGTSLLHELHRLLSIMGVRSAAPKQAFEEHIFSVTANPEQQESFLGKTTTERRNRMALVTQTGRGKVFKLAPPNAEHPYGDLETAGPGSSFGVNDVSLVELVMPRELLATGGRLSTETDAAPPIVRPTIYYSVFNLSPILRLRRQLKLLREKMPEVRVRIGYRILEEPRPLHFAIWVGNYKYCSVPEIMAGKGEAEQLAGSRRPGELAVFRS
jgi:hypothetical protein